MLTLEVKGGDEGIKTNGCAAGSVCEVWSRQPSKFCQSLAVPVAVPVAVTTGTASTALRVCGITVANVGVFKNHL